MGQFLFYLFSGSPLLFQELSVRRWIFSVKGQESAKVL